MTTALDPAQQLRHDAMKDIWRLPILTDAQERRIVRQARAGDERARAELIRRHLRLVASIARRACFDDAKFPDLFQEGVIGLMQAYERFDPERGVRFSTYATWWVRQAVLQARRTDDMIRRPRSAISDPDGPRAELLLDAPDALPEGLVDRTSTAVVDLAVLSASRAELRRAMRRLPRRERTILALRYGFDGRPTRSFDETSRLLGVSRETVRLAERRALKKLMADPQLGALSDTPEAAVPSVN